MKIETMLNGHEEHAGYWAEGHQDARRFVHAIEGEELDRRGVATERDKDKVEHLYASMRPIEPGVLDSDMSLHFSKEQGEDAFPVTVIFD